MDHVKESPERAPRILCARCQYIRANCLCHAIKVVSNTTRVVVLQHPTEVQHAKNSVKVLQRMLSKIDVVVGEQPHDFLKIKHDLTRTGETPILLFPAKNASSFNVGMPTGECRPKTLIVLDGSWKKAKKILYLNPWLLQFPCVKLDEIHSFYRLRKTSVTGGLSTLEAVAHALHALDQLDVAPFQYALEALMQTQIRHMRPEVARRYE